MSQQVGLARRRAVVRWAAMGELMLLTSATGCVEHIKRVTDDAAQEQPTQDASDTAAAGDVASDFAPPEPLPLASACTQDTDCASGHCVEGVCCSSTCDGICRSCRLTGSEGTCAAAPSGTDPLDDCADQGPSSCGQDGTCDGTGSCRKYRPGTICRALQCVGDQLRVALTCDGQGACGNDVPVSCAPYRCGPSGCLQSCTSDAQCTTGTFCISGSCGPRPVGAECSSDAQCGSSYCRQGRCCKTDCGGTCWSCDVPSREGVCSTVPDGEDLLSQCVDQSAASCGTDGTCDGNGACRMYAAGTGCGDRSCQGSTQNAAPTCDGKGTCQNGNQTSCAPYMCGIGTCLTSCSTNVQCLEPARCHQAHCQVTSVRAEYAALVTSASAASVRFEVRITNQGSVPIPMLELKARYWLTIDDTKGTQSYACVTASVGCANVQVELVDLQTDRAKAGAYLQLSFGTSAGDLPPGGSTGPIEVELSSKPAVTYNQDNDYSFDALMTSPTASVRFTVYRDGDGAAPVWGEEPPMTAPDGGQD